MGRIPSPRSAHHLLSLRKAARTQPGLHHPGLSLRIGSNGGIRRGSHALSASAIPLHAPVPCSRTSQRKPHLHCSIVHLTHFYMQSSAPTHSTPEHLHRLPLSTPTARRFPRSRIPPRMHASNMPSMLESLSRPHRLRSLPPLQSSGLLHSLPPVPTDVHNLGQDPNP